MKKIVLLILLMILSSQAFAWKYTTGKVDVLYVNAYGNYSEAHLNQGYCFKLIGFDHYFKISYAESGEKYNNLQLVQSMVLAAFMADKEVRVTYVDWGEDTSCRVNGAAQTAKWIENVQVLN